MSTSQAEHCAKNIKENIANGIKNKHVKLTQHNTRLQVRKITLRCFKFLGGM